jgi:hypothetical protein
MLRGEELNFGRRKRFLKVMWMMALRKGIVDGVVPMNMIW